MPPAPQTDFLFDDAGEPSSPAPVAKAAGASKPAPVAKEPPKPRVFTPGELNGAIRQLLENNFPQVWVRGEVSNFKRQANGHCYFSLKDAGGQISAVLFRGDAAKVRAELRDGAQLVVCGDISVYEPRGTYQIIVRQVTEDGQGKLQAELEKLRQKLTGEGLFERSRKKALPLRAVTIGVITSPTGAALQDFIRILQRRGWTGRLIVFPSRVQGLEAVGDMLDMMAQAEAMGDLELLVIARGGGSLEDLWCFNDERLVRAVAACRLPIISAVGHEVDFTLCDFAADVRAETPSGAAELISSGAMAYADTLADLRQRLDRRLDDALEAARERLTWLRRTHAQVSPEKSLERASLRLDDFANRLEAIGLRHLHALRDGLAGTRLRLRDASPASRLALARSHLGQIRRRWVEVPGRQLPEKSERLRQLGLRLRAAGPSATLARGFVIVRDADGRVVESSRSPRPGDVLTLTFRDGTVRVSVEKDS